MQFFFYHFLLTLILPVSSVIITGMCYIVHIYRDLENGSEWNLIPAQIDRHAGFGMPGRKTGSILLQDGSHMTCFDGHVICVDPAPLL